MKKFRLLPLLLAFALLPACTGGSLIHGSVQPLPTPQGTLPPVEPLENTAEGALDGYRAFSLDLLRRNLQKGENALLSPLSVALALGMTANGAAGDTLAGFETLFGLGRDDLNALCARFMTDYTSLGGSTQATVVNSLWADPEAALANGFVLRCQETYAAQLFQRDLQDPETVKAVNRWVSDATRGLIPKVVEEFSGDAVLALVNAVYLKNQFARPFETPQSDWELDFTAADGTVSHPKGMSNGTRDEEYIAAGDGQGVLLPYDDGRLGLLLMLPEEGVSLADYLAKWNGETVPELLSAREERLVSLTCPKFKADWGSSLAASLQAMGLETAFDPDRADFSAMGSGANGEPLYIGDVVHKTAFELNEKGTEAAAVTAVMMECGAAMPPEDLVYLRFDRPFVYAIVDTELGVPLFLGTVEAL